jgi:hypothetical protein
MASPTTFEDREHQLPSQSEDSGHPLPEQEPVVSPLEQFHSTTSSKPSGDATRSTTRTTVVPLREVRHERKVRGTDQFMCWYEVARTSEEPPSLPAKTGDLFLERCGDASELRVWLWESDRWNKIASEHPHPLLPNRVLYINPSGDPRWVTRKTLTTYRSRKRDKTL